MQKIYVYYENENTKANESTNVFIKLFENYVLSHKFMNDKRKEYINNLNYIPDKIDGNGDKSWCRLYKDESKKNYIDLIIEEHEIS